ncbi:hypothetical protein TYRP_009766 [Tyrophagus putrescentiae]|nr:hypothetical protein TYRP_009766 [Tyrophagus putrescentiae]
MTTSHRRHQLKEAVLVSVGVGHRLPEHVHQLNVVGLIQRQTFREGRIEAKVRGGKAGTPGLRPFHHVRVS